MQMNRHPFVAIQKAIHRASKSIIVSILTNLEQQLTIAKVLKVVKRDQF